MAMVGQLGSAGINAAANATSTVLTNKTNREIADATNAEAKRQFDTNLEWLKTQYYDSQEFNSPSAVRERMVAAGFNPLWAENNGSPSSAVGGVSPTASMSTPQMMAPQFDVSKDILNMSNAREVDSRYQYQEMQNEMLDDMLDAGKNPLEQQWRSAEEIITKTMAERGETLTRAQYNRAAAQLCRANSVQARAAAEKALADAKATNWQTAFNQVNESSLREQLERGVEEINEHIRLMQSQEIANVAAAKSSNALAHLTEEQKIGLAFKNTWTKFGVTENSEMLTRLSALISDGKMTVADANNYMETVAKNLTQTKKLAKKYDLMHESNYIWHRGEDAVRRFNAISSALGNAFTAASIAGQDAISIASGEDGVIPVLNELGKQEQLSTPAWDKQFNVTFGRFKSKKRK